MFEKVAGKRGVLLSCAASGSAARLKRLRLTFDVGVMELVTEGSSLVCQSLPAGSEATGLRSWGEEDPWWKLMGQPISRVIAESRDCIRLQWRHDSDNPTVVEIKSSASGIEVRTVS